MASKLEFSLTPQKPFTITSLARTAPDGFSVKAALAR